MRLASYGISPVLHLIYIYRTMTNKEILQADLLDILFENRNKDYGAYALRRTYDTRLLKALGAGLGLAALLCAAAMSGKNDQPLTEAGKTDGILIKEYVMPHKKPEEIKQPEQPQKKIVQQKPVAKKARVKYVNKFDIKKDELVKTTVAPVESLADKTIGDTDSKGQSDDGLVMVPETASTGTGEGSSGTASEPGNFVARESAPEFPGGPMALYNYLAKNLRTPDDLDAGDKILVKVRFKVDVDGAVTGFEIVESGGAEFDSEVLRVCKKMPRWKPGFQNGVNVAVNYMIPVTFVGPE